MTFINNVGSPITNANPGPALLAALEPTLLALGFVLDDTVVNGGNTHKLYKSAAAGNAYGLDWWLDINYPTTGTTGGLRITPFESYNAATDQATRGPYSASGVTAPDAATYSRFGATPQALETQWANNASYTGLSLVLGTSGLLYWASITRNRVVLMLSSDPQQISYAGFFTPTADHAAQAGAAMFPLITARIQSGQDASSSTSFASVRAALTRIPKFTALGQGSGLVSWGSYLFLPVLDTHWALGGIVGSNVHEGTGKIDVLPTPVVMGSAQRSVGSVYGGRVGSLDGVGSAFVASTAVRGDHFVDTNGDSWYGANPATGFGLFMKAA